MPETQTTQATLVSEAEKRSGEAVAAGSVEPEILDQLMKPEVQKSLTELVENLPKLTEMVTMLTKAYDVAKTVANDRILIDDLKGGFEEFVKPIQEKAKGIAAAAIEANERAQAESATTIGLFGLIRILKDPQVQRVLRFGQAFLDVMAEKKN